MTLLGIDYGRVHVGLAIGHSETHLALPLRTFTGLPAHDLLEAIRHEAKKLGVDAFVVGMPVSLAGERDASGIRQDVESFGTHLQSLTGLPVRYVDERYSTQEAIRLRRDYPSADEHALAAMLVLQSALDRVEA